MATPNGMLRSSLMFSCLTFTSLSVLAAAAPATSVGEPNKPMQEVLDLYKSLQGTPITDLLPQKARQQVSIQDAAKALARMSQEAEQAESTELTVDGMVIPTPDGDLPIRVYHPRGVSGKAPITVYFHGGGFVIATIDTYDASGRALANASGSIVVSVEYRKAPEHRFPAALHDALWSYQWVLKHGGELGGDTGRVAVAGESAGGNLATEICLHAKTDGFKMPDAELLVYPVTDFSVKYPSDQIYAKAAPLNTPALVWFTSYYFASPAQASDPDASPLRSDLHGLPPTTIIAAQIDPLQDEGRAYADKLKAAGVSVHYRLYPGTTHEFFGLGAVLPDAKAAVAFAGADLKTALGQ